MDTDPLVARSRPARQCIRVDFPDPDGPMIAVNCPAANETDTASNAVTAQSPDPYRLVSIDAAAPTNRASATTHSLSGTAFNTHPSSSRPYKAMTAPMLVARR